MIIWERDTRKFSNGYFGFRKQMPFKLFYIVWVGDDGMNKEKPWRLKTTLPGFKETLGHFKEKERAMEMAQLHLLSWMNALGFTIERVRPTKQSD